MLTIVWYQKYFEDILSDNCLACNNSALEPLQPEVGIYSNILNGLSYE